MGIWIFQILQIIKCISSTISYNWETSGCLTKNPIGIVLKHLASVFFLWDHCTSLISAWSDSSLSKEGPVDVYIYLKYSDMSWRLFFWSNPFLGWKRHGWWGFLGIWDPEKTPGWLSIKILPLPCPNLEPNLPVRKLHLHCEMVLALLSWKS